MNFAETSPFKKALRLLVLIFIFVNALTIVFRARLEDKNVDTGVVIGGNLILFVVSALSVWMYSKAGKQQKAHGIIRNVYGGFMLKFFALLVAAMVYFYFASEINKAAIFICLGLYLLYNFAGVSQFAKRQPPVADAAHHQHHDHKHAAHHHHK
jgi:Ca2+/Na+ antiporter